MIGQNLPLWMEVLRAIGPTIGSLLVFLTAGTAAVVAWKTYRQRKAADDLAYRQRKEADAREELWRRTQWAIDYASAPDEGRAGIGLEVLNRLSVSPLADGEDRELVQAMLGEVIAARAKRDYNGSTADTAEEPRAGRRLRRMCRGK